MESLFTDQNEEYKKLTKSELVRKKQNIDLILLRNPLQFQSPITLKIPLLIKDFLNNRLATPLFK